jgi:hypothetical protein
LVVKLTLHGLDSTPLLICRALAAEQLMAAIKDLPFGRAWLPTDVVREMEGAVCD